MEDILSAPRRIKQLITFVIDITIHALTYTMSIFIGMNSLDVNFNPTSYMHFLVLTILSIMSLRALGFYRTVNRFVSFKILLYISANSLVLAFVYFILGKSLELDYAKMSSSVLYACLLCILLSGSRLLVRSYFNTRFNTQKKKVIIYGAGSAGRQLSLSLIGGNEYYPVAFIDDDRNLEDTVIQGTRVFSPEKIEELSKNNDIQKVLLALPSISRAQRKLIISRVEKAGVAVQTIPGMADIVAGKMKIDEFQDVDIEDLLGRDSVPPVQDLLNKNIKNKVVMVTGAGGSIGSELCRQIIALKPKALILFEVSEFALYSIDKELSHLIASQNLECSVKPILGTIQDKIRLQKTLGQFKVETIYHAAAYKHVPMVEHNMTDGVKNNIFGTLNVAEAAIEHAVESFVLVSTDKAVRPTNVMGATKRFAELVLQGLAEKQCSTCFSMVRFGNVLGSSGSVIPVFKKQIKEGGPVTVTHPDIIRYFMTIPEAAQLVIQAGAMAKGGDVFVLDMGEPVKIIELAEKLILLMGLEVKHESKPSGDIEITYTGLRPGEKLYEELLVGSDVEGTNHPRIMTAREKFLKWPEVNKLLVVLKKHCDNYNFNEVRKVLLDAPTDYRPDGEIKDYLSPEKGTNNKNILKLPR